MQIDILTLFPEIFPGPLGESIVGRAMTRNLVRINAVDLRNYADDARGTVDDKPYGGGPGMLMKVEPLVKAVEDLRKPGSMVILTSPRGERFSQPAARELAKQEHLIVIAGHYEGVDERAIELTVDREFSLGDFVLTNGNLAAMVMADAIVRLLPACSAAMNRASTSLTRRICLSTRNIRVRRNSGGARCRRFCFPATTRGSTHGDWLSPNG